MGFEIIIYNFMCHDILMRRLTSPPSPPPPPHPNPQTPTPQHRIGGYSKTRYKKLVTHAETHASAVSLLESGEQRYIKAIIVVIVIVIGVQELCESRGGRPGLSVLTSLLVSVDVKLY